MTHSQRCCDHILPYHRHGGEQRSKHCTKREANGCQVTWNDDDFEIGVIKMWNEDRNYGIIVRMCDYTEIFCHRSNFADDLDQSSVGDLVWMRIEYDDERGRDQAVEVEAATEDEMYAFADRKGIAEELMFFGHLYDNLNATQVD